MGHLTQGTDRSPCPRLCRGEFLFHLVRFRADPFVQRAYPLGAISFASYGLQRVARLTPLHVLTALPFVYFAIVQNQAIYSESFGVIKTVLNLGFLQSWVPVSDYYF